MRLYAYRRCALAYCVNRPRKLKYAVKSGPRQFISAAVWQSYLRDSIDIIWVHQEVKREKPEVASPATVVIARGDADELVSSDQFCDEDCDGDEP